MNYCTLHLNPHLIHPIQKKKKIIILYIKSNKIFITKIIIINFIYNKNIIINFNDDYHCSKIIFYTLYLKYIVYLDIFFLLKDL